MREHDDFMGPVRQNWLLKPTGWIDGGDCKKKVKWNPVKYKKKQSRLKKQQSLAAKERYSEKTTCKIFKDGEKCYFIGRDPQGRFCKMFISPKFLS